MRASVLEVAHVGEAQSAKIDHRTGTLGDYIDARAALIMSAFTLMPRRESFHFWRRVILLREFVDGIHTILRRKSGVRRADRAR